MAVTLSDVRANTQDALCAQVIDEFRKSSFLLDNMIFDDAVSPVGGGASPTYSYTRVSTQPTASSRALNAEYAPQEAKKERVFVDLKVLGGAFEIDRVLAGMGGIVDEVQFQMQQKIKAVQALFADMVINGDSSVNPTGFDGLSKALAYSNTECFDSDYGDAFDLSSSAAVDKNYMGFLDALDEMLCCLDGAPSCILGNTQMIAKLRACARRAAMYQTTKDDWGRQVEMYGNVPIVDLGAKAGSNVPIIGNVMQDGILKTDLYIVRLGLDGLHGVSMSGESPIKTFLPDFSTPGAVKKGEVEMVSAIALKNQYAAAVMRGIHVWANA